MSDEIAPEPTPTEGVSPHAPFTRQKVVSSASWIVFGFGYTQVVRLVSTVILSHLLDPYYMGLSALAFTYLTGLILFSDLGIRTSVVQNSRGDDRDFLNTAWTLQIIRGFILCMACCILAWPAAFWRPKAEPALLLLLPVFGGMSIVEGFISTKLISLYRHLDQRRAVLMDAFTQTAGLATMLIWAKCDPGVAALAIGPVVTAVCRLLLSHFMLPGQPNGLRWERSSLRELLHFARWIYLSTILSFLAGNVDKLVIGFGSVETLGIYGVAASLSSSVFTLMAAGSSQLIFPLYSRLLQNGRDLRPYLGRTHLAAGGLAALFVAGLIAAGPTLIRCLWDPRYHGASKILPLLALGAWLQVAENNAATIFFAQGKPKWPAFSNGVKVVCLCVSVPLGWWIAELRGLIIGFIVGDFARYVATALFLRMQHFNIFGLDVAWTIFAVGTGLLGLTIGQHFFPDLEAGKGELLLRFCVEGTTVVAIWCPTMLLLRWRGYFQALEPSPLGAPGR